jgi:Ni,Fe-hydrogenase III large subunit
MRTPVSYILAIGPNAPYWPGPQRLVLTVDGETVTDMNYRPDDETPAYLERIPRLDQERLFQQMVRSHRHGPQAHALACCLALEALAGITAPERASYLRCAIAEVERTWSHLGTLRTIFAALGQQRVSESLSILQEQVQAVLLALLQSSSDAPEMLLPGGVRRDIDDEQRELLFTMLTEINGQFFPLIDQTIDEAHLLERTVGVGTLSREVCEQFMLNGPLARAAGIEVDTRLDEPYTAYAHLNMRRILQDGGDVHARIVVLLLEAFEGLKLAEQALYELPAGALQTTFPLELPHGSARAAVEAPRGRLTCALESDGYRLNTLTFEEPRQVDRLLARTLFVGALVDNVIVIALSTDPGVPRPEKQAIV